MTDTFTPKSPSEKQLKFIDSLSAKNKIKLDKEKITTMREASLIIQNLYEGNESIDISMYLLPGQEDALKAISKAASKKQSKVVNVVEKPTCESCIKNKIVLCHEDNNSLKPKTGCKMLCESSSCICEYLDEKELINTNNKQIYLVHCRK